MAWQGSGGRQGREPCRSHTCWPACVTVAGGLIAAPGALAGTRWGTNKLSAAAKATIFDSTFSANGTEAEGYPNPDSPQTAKTTSITAKKKKDALDSFTIGDNLSSASVVNSTRNKGAKNKIRYKAGSGGIGG